MALKYRRRLLDHLSHESYSPRRKADLAKDLAIEDPDEFDQALDQLADEGVIDIAESGLITLPSVGGQGGEIEGSFKLNPKGFGFVRTDNPLSEGDLFIPPDMTGAALSGDRVRARVKRERQRGSSGGGAGAGGRSPFVGEIVEILERKRAQFTGELRQQGGQWLVHPAGREPHPPLIVRAPQAKNAKGRLLIRDYQTCSGREPATTS